MGSSPCTYVGAAYALFGIFFGTLILAPLLYWGLRTWLVRKDPDNKRRRIGFAMLWGLLVAPGLTVLRGLLMPLADFAGPVPGILFTWALASSFAYLVETLRRDRARLRENGSTGQ